MNYCSACGRPVTRVVPDGDDRPRAVCAACGRIHYENPVVVVGCVVERGDEVLLCRRAIEPARGRWTLPSGYLELGEGLIEGARRETLEEAGADVEITAPLAQLDLPHIGQTHSLFRARLRGAVVAAGKESLEVAFFAAAAIPFDELAFPANHFALRLWLDDRGAGRHVHTARLWWNGAGSRFDARQYELRDHLRVPVAGRAD